MQTKNTTLGPGMNVRHRDANDPHEWRGTVISREGDYCRVGWWAGHGIGPPITSQHVETLTPLPLAERYH